MTNSHSTFHTFGAGAAAALVLLAGALAPRAALAGEHGELPSGDGGRGVTVETLDGDLVCTIVVENESLRRVLGDLCGALAIELEGFDGTKRTALVTADLRRQPLERALEYVLGSVGLRGALRTDALVVSEDALDRVERAELLRMAASAYRQASAAHPDHELVAGASVAQGRIEEERGNLGAALDHYQTVLQEYAASHAFAEALYRSGTIRERLSEWSTASLVFRQLVNLGVAHDFEALGRQELARCFVRLGDHGTALATLGLLEDHHPAESERDRFARQSLRAEALLGSGEPIECLRILEQLDGSGLALEDRLSVQALRARAFEGLEMKAEAGRAWLVYAHGATDSEHAHAIERAISLALEEEDELGVLFAVSQARTPELRLELAPFAREAREELGLLAAADADELSIKEILDLADEESTSGDPEGAMKLLEPLLARRAALSNDVRLRLALAFGSALHALSRAEDAFVFLGEERAATADPEARRRIDVLAAGLLEADGRFDDAVRAYEGSYP